MTQNNMLAALEGVRPSVEFEDDQPRIRDVDLGAALEYARPRDIRKTIAPLHNDGLLPGAVVKRSHSGTRADSARRSESLNLPPQKTASEEYWLDMTGAVYTIVKSGTPKANELTKLVVAVFVDFLTEQARLNSAPMFLAAPRDWERLWEPEVVSGLCALYGHSSLYRRGGPMPGQWFASVETKVYKHLWGLDHLAEARERIPNPRHGTNLHQLLSPEAFAVVVSELQVIGQVAYAHADRPSAVPRFWGWMGGRYLKRPEQFDLPGILHMPAESDAIRLQQTAVAAKVAGRKK